MFRACEMYGMAPMVRVYNPYDGPMMSRLLDVGAHGIMVPLVNDGAQAKNIVDSTKYAPWEDGELTGGGGPRWGAYDDYVKVCNDNTLTFVQCESIEGVNNIEEIAALPGVDGVFIGTGDLSLEMGIKFKADSSANHTVDSPEMVAAIDKILQACLKNGKDTRHCNRQRGGYGEAGEAGLSVRYMYERSGIFLLENKAHLKSIRELVGK